MKPLFTPGLQYYVDHILEGPPFSFIKYGEGELIVSAIPDHRLNPQRRLPGSIGSEDSLREAIIEGPVDDRYMKALFRLGWIRKAIGPQVVEWVDANTPPETQWHNGRVWHLALQAGEFFPMIEAIGAQSLPVVLVGPPELGEMRRLTNWNVLKHIRIHRYHAWQDKDHIKAEILKTGEPAFYIFCAGVLKVLIYELWPTVGQESFMIDFGSVFDPLCGFCSRRPWWDLTLRTLWKNLGREPKRERWGSLVDGAT